jgi:hypothetical protein
VSLSLGHLISLILASALDFFLIGWYIRMLCTCHHWLPLFQNFLGGYEIQWLQLPLTCLTTCEMKLNTDNVTNHSQSKYVKCGSQTLAHITYTNVSSFHPVPSVPEQYYSRTVYILNVQLVCVMVHSSRRKHRPGLDTHRIKYLSTTHLT